MKKARETLSVIIAIWCTLMTVAIVFAFFTVDDINDVLSLGDASVLSLWFVVFIGLSVIWFMIRSLEKDEDPEEE